MKEQQNQKIEAITETTLVVGVDVAKKAHWARFVNNRGMEVGKGISFKSDRAGFESIITRIEILRNNKAMKNPFDNVDNVVIGMEPTGHYWKTLAAINAGR
jgi:transposase